ncbi:MAG: transporter substrate-binding domain-containing protein [Candidatus Delongbacteria bacterium]|nr:transporter substrate-binding domain-containing protein [Candidatus Delongbacteria bacterium]MBN2835974.1 transporter substrate-binding domain-containing protein [Candidatus Delongbacteria bacterium]
MKMFLLFLVVFSLYGEKIVIASGDWEPFTSSRDENGKLLELIVNEVFKNAGIDVEYLYYPWKRSYELVKSGKADATFPWMKTEERLKEVIYPNESILLEKSVFFHLKSTNFSFTNDADLKKYKFGGTLGYSLVGYLKDKGLEVDEVGNEILNFKKLLANRIDVYPTSFIVGYNLINREFPPEQAALFTNSPNIISEDEYFLVFSKSSENGKSLSEKFDKGLKMLKESGRYDEIMNSFLDKK